MNDIKIENITKSYKGKEGRISVLENLSLSLEAGKVHAIVGPSGCGKSTLLMLSGGLIHPDSGRILIGETDLFSLSAGERSMRQASLVGFVFQHFHLIPYLNTQQNIMASCLARPVKDAEAHCATLMDRLGLTHRRGHIPAKLSSGEQQRVALGRALMNSPKVLIADEPTGNLDSDNTDQLLGLIREFADDGGLVLMATHDKHVAAFADYEHRFKDGGFGDSSQCTVKE